MPEHRDPASGSIFNAPWWLDVTADRNWEPIESAPRSGYIARLPLYVGRSFRQRAVRMPPLTKTLLPTFSRVSGRDDLSLKIRRLLVDDLISKIPDRLPVILTFDPTFDELYPFSRAGYHVDLEYTFRIQDCAEQERLWRGLQASTRNQIRRSRERHKVEPGADPATIVAFYARNIARTGTTMRPDRELMLRIVEAATARGVGRAFVCAGSDGAPVAAIFVVHDDSWCYLLLSTRDRDLADNGAIGLLIWEALLWAGEKNVGFDFDSPNNYNIQFGGSPVPRWRVSRMSRIARTALLFATDMRL